MISQQIYLMADVYFQVSDSMLHFGNDHLELQFSKTTGNLIAGLDKVKDFRFQGIEGGEKPSVLLRVGGELKYPGVVRNSRVFDLVGEQEIGKDTTYHSHKVFALDRKIRLEITVKEGDWLITSIFDLSPNNNTISRDFRVTYLGEGEVLLRDVRIMVPYLQVGTVEDTLIEAPDYPVTTHFPLINVPDGIWEGLDSRTLSAPGKVQHSVDAPGSVVGLVALYNPNERLSIMCWPHSTSEFSIMELEKEANNVHLTQWLFTADRFRVGHSIQAGRQYLRLGHSDWETAMRGFQCWYDEIGVTVPLDRPEWTHGVTIYEVHVGRAPFLNGIHYQPYPEMSDLLDDLPRISDMGFEVIQIMPHWPFCGYTVHDYYQVDQQYGNKGDLKAVVQLAHHLGMKVILDIVLHGCVDKEIIRWDMAQFGSHYDFIFKEWLELADEHSHYRDDHPDWFMKDEEGRTAKIYTWAFDPANCSFQEFIVAVLKYYITELGVDGFRFDAPTWNCMPNWERGLPYRASASYYGAFHLLNHVRTEIKKVAPQALLYTEPSGPLFRHSMDLTYNYDVEWLSGSLISPLSKRGYAGARIYTGGQITAKEAALWFHYHRLTLPKHSSTVYHLDSHDTFWWGEMAQFRYEAFGNEASRALFAMFALVEGGLMNYVGGENDSEDFYKRLIHLRQKTPALRNGYCDYLAVACNNEMVFPLLRSHHRDTLIPLINLSVEDTEIRVQLPLDKLNLGNTKEFLIYDEFNGVHIETQNGKRCLRSDLKNLAVKMPGYGVRILKVIPVERDIVFENANEG